MKKTLMVNLSGFKIEGDIIDFSLEEFSLLDCNSNEEQNEKCSEIALTNEEELYDSGIIFFNLNKIWNPIKREDILNDMMGKIKKDGYIYIWDLNKSFGEVVDVELKVLCPDGKFKNVNLKTNNIFSSLSIEEIEKSLEKNCIIEETKVWEDMFYIKAQKNN
ncbi:hypothetical protein [uncultured Clostridium sp.]|uniref:hypothetical protein n=1 Tax=uncultured Clostridium sp. TaxID=59620 RepID=UPI00263203F7|nr:hypothetical protein [uncultured Clostridium sp.]